MVIDPFAFRGPMQFLDLCIFIQGDSGGPLSIKGDDGIFQVIGLTSFNVGGCVSENPKIFTNVTYFVSWIEDKIAEF